jgi:L-threonylcarbamoyladenylate synthase
MITHLLDEHELERAAELLKIGEVVAFPTETVYGLGARIFSEQAALKIFAAKGRPRDNPLIAHVSSLEQIDRITSHLPPYFEKLYDAFFPGPLTVVVARSKLVPSAVCANLDSIALRMPSHPLAKALIDLVGEPIVAPSANISGRPSSTHFSHVMDDFTGKIAAVIKGGSSQIGLESTVISLLGEKPVLMRPGFITKKQLEQVLGCSVLIGCSQSKEAPISPGMKYRHYAPKANVRLFEEKGTLISYLQSCLSQKSLILSSTPFSIRQADEHRILSAKTLYEALRYSDHKGFDQVLVLLDEEILSDDALMNRLLKASCG